MLFNKFFRLSIRALVAKIWPIKLCDGAQMANFGQFLGPAFLASHMQHISDLHSKFELECGPVPNVMVALPNIGGALCSTPQSLADAHC